MNKNFDFSAEMNEAQVPAMSPEKDFLAEEKRLLEENAQRIVNLNKSIDLVFDDLNDLTKFLKVYNLSIKQSTIAQAEKFGDAILERFAQRIDARCAETEQRIAKAENFICISPITFYILIVLLLAFFSFFIIMIMENAEILHSGLVWKTIAYCGLITAVGIGMVILLAKYLGRRN